MRLLTLRKDGGQVWPLEKRENIRQPAAYRMVGTYEAPDFLYSVM